jgi:hypothetical protein
VGKKIGEGSFGVVFEGWSLSSSSSPFRRRRISAIRVHRSPQCNAISFQ